MTPTERSLLDAVLREPYSDLPRLVYAEWLEENGEPERAEFIRLQIEYAKWFDPHEHSPRGEPIRTRLNELWSGKNHDGLGYQFDSQPLQSRMDWENCKSENNIVVYRRGFPSAVSLTLRSFMGGPINIEEWERHYVVTGTHITERHVQFDRKSIEVLANPSGTVPGLVESLGSRWPIVSVTLTDREPWDIVASPPYNWRWFDESRPNRSGDHPESDLPKEIYKRLSGPSKRGNTCDYIDRAAAMTALDHAATDLLRERAGLPAMRWE